MAALFPCSISLSVYVILFSDLTVLISMLASNTGTTVRINSTFLVLNLKNTQQSVFTQKQAALL